MIATKMSETFTREQHEGIISDLKKRYKREALRACEIKYEEGRQSMKAELQVAVPVKNKKVIDQAALVSKITAKLKSKYKAEALRACEVKFEEGRQSMKAELQEAVAEKKKEFKQAVLDAKSESERESRRRRQLQETTDRALASKDDTIEKLQAQIRNNNSNSGGSSNGKSNNGTELSTSHAKIQAVLDEAYSRAKRILLSGSAEDMSSNEYLDLLRTTLKGIAQSLTSTNDVPASLLKSVKAELKEREGGATLISSTLEKGGTSTSFNTNDSSLPSNINTNTNTTNTVDHQRRNSESPLPVRPTSTKSNHSTILDSNVSSSQSLSSSPSLSLPSSSSYGIVLYEKQWEKLKLAPSPWFEMIRHTAQDLTTFSVPWRVGVHTPTQQGDGHSKHIEYEIISQLRHDINHMNTMFVDGKLTYWEVAELDKHLNGYTSPIKGKNNEKYLSSRSSSESLPTKSNRRGSLRPRVFRRYRDFDWLYNRMYDQFPGIIVPTLPPKGSMMVEDHFGVSFVNRRRRALHYWLGHIVGHPLMGNTPEVRMFLGASREQLKKAKHEEPEIHPLLEQQIAIAHKSMDPSLGDKRLDPNKSAEWCTLYDIHFSQKERFLSRIARAATTVADKCDEIEKSYQALGEAFSVLADKMGEMSWLHEEDQIGSKLWRMPIVDTKSHNGFNTNVTSSMTREIRSAYSFMGHQLLPVARKSIQLVKGISSVKQPAVKIATAVRISVERRAIMESYSNECIRPLLQMASHVASAAKTNCDRWKSLKKALMVDTKKLSSTVEKIRKKRDANTFRRSSLASATRGGTIDQHSTTKTILPTEGSGEMRHDTMSRPAIPKSKRKNPKLKPSNSWFDPILNIFGGGSDDVDDMDTTTAATAAAAANYNNNYKSNDNDYVEHDKQGGDSMRSMGSLAEKTSYVYIDGNENDERISSDSNDNGGERISGFDTKKKHRKSKNTKTKRERSYSGNSHPVQRASRYGSSSSSSFSSPLDNGDKSSYDAKTSNTDDLMNKHVERRRKQLEKKEKEEEDHEEQLRKMAEDTKKQKEEMIRRKREKGAKARAKKRELAAQNKEQERRKAREDAHVRREKIALEKIEREKQIEEEQRRRKKMENEMNEKKKRKKKNDEIERQRRDDERRKKQSFAGQAKASIPSNRHSNQASNTSNNISTSTPAAFSTSSKSASSISSKISSCNDTKWKKDMKKEKPKDGWVAVQDDEGKTYYYHQVTRQVRWIKPEGVLLEKMEARIASEEEEKVKRQHERLNKLHREEERKKKRTEQGNTIQKEIEVHVKKWVNNARSKRVSAFCPSQAHSMLYQLLFTLPALLNSFDSGLIIPKNVHPPQTAETESNHLKKSYIKTLRIVHPDKVKVDASVRMQITAKLVFAALNEAFNYYKNS